MGPTCVISDRHQLVLKVPACEPALTTVTFWDVQVHNGIEYGDMQLISEAYDVLKTIGGLTNDELAAAFIEWNQVGPCPTSS
jgi:hypothetical protein